MEQKHVEVKRMELTGEQRSQIVKDTLSTWWLSSVIALVRTVGSEKAIEILGPVMYRLGKDSAEKSGVGKNIEGTGATDLASMINLFEEEMGMKGEVIEVGGERVAKVLMSCPLSKCPPEICQLMECYARGMSKVIAPEFTFIQEATMTRGDDQCRWVVRRK